VGEKTAARLVADYPDLDALQAARDRLPPRLADALGRSAAYIQAMRQVVPVTAAIPFEESRPAPADRERLQDLGRRHAMDGPVSRLLAALDQVGLDQSAT
jgi:5'-3' exonuclease